MQTDNFNLLDNETGEQQLDNVNYFAGIGGQEQINLDDQPRKETNYFTEEENTDNNQLGDRYDDLAQLYDEPVGQPQDDDMIPDYSSGPRKDVQNLQMQGDINLDNQDPFVSSQQSSNQSSMRSNNQDIEAQVQHYRNQLLKEGANAIIQNQFGDSAQPTPEKEKKEKKGQSCFGLCTIEYWQQYFDVTTDDVTHRLISSVKPIGGPDKFLEEIKQNPDLYGPVWILATWVVLLAISVILERYINGSLDDDDFSWEFVNSAASLLSIFGIGTPVACAVFLKCFGADEVRWVVVSISFSLFNVFKAICIYGYSQTIYLPATLICMIPFGLLQFVVLVLAAVQSCSMLTKNFNHYLDKLENNTHKFTIMGLVLFAQVFQVLLLKYYYF